MSWTRFDDNWSVKMEALGLDVEEVGYLVHLIQHCSRSNTYDGRLTAFKAGTIAEASDPDKILAHLAEVGRVRWEGATCVVLHLDDHLPPPAMREDARKEAERGRKRRQRAHAKGDHSLCDPDTCPADVPPGQDLDTTTGEIRPTNVPPGPGTGQDGPGQEEVPQHEEAIEYEPDPWLSLPRQGVVDPTECQWCDGSGCPQCSDDYEEALR